MPKVLLQDGNGISQVSIDIEGTRNSIGLKAELRGYKVVFKVFKVGKILFIFSFVKGRESRKSSKVFQKDEGRGSYFSIRVGFASGTLIFSNENVRACRRRLFGCIMRSRLCSTDSKG